MIEAVDLAIHAIFTKRCEDLGLRVCDLPAWPLRVKIGRTFLPDIFRAVQNLPAGFLAFPEI